MKYWALRFAGRFFLSGRGWRGTAPRGNASLPTIAAGGGNGRTWVVHGVGAQLCAPTLGGGRNRVRRLGASSTRRAGCLTVNRGLKREALIPPDLSIYLSAPTCGAGCQTGNLNFNLLQCVDTPVRQPAPQVV